jgi:hypothetical protein
MAEPKTLPLFNRFKLVIEDAGEMFQPDKIEEKLLKRLDDECDASPWFEPEPEPSNVLLQDSANLRRPSSGHKPCSRNTEAKSHKIQTQCPWLSMLNK